MITTYTNNTYRITYDGVNMVENALDNPNLVQISTVVGCAILVAPDADAGIEYLPNGEYRQWTLTGRNTRLAKKEAHYIYARLSREGNDALIVFSQNDYNVDGSIYVPPTEEEEPEAQDDAPNPPSQYYYYIKIGSITATDADYTSTATLDREISFDGGYLSTAQSTDENAGNSGDWKKMFQLTADGLIKALKNLASFTVKGTLTLIGKLVLNEKQITDVARSTDNPVKEADDETIPTTAYLRYKFADLLSDKFLRKDRDDETPFNLRIGSIQSNNIGTKEFVDGWLGVGGRMWVDELGKVNLEVDNIRARDTLETMTFRFNMIDVISGEMWNTFAYGTIKSVDTERQIVRLDLVDGELMTAHVNDFLRGIFHNVRIENNTSSAKDECGFEQIQGFTTAYFTPVALLGDKTGFKYQLRPGTSVHPCPGMKFAAYGNLSDKNRQATTYSTRTRLIMMEKVNTWIIDPDRNYVYVRGQLEGLTYMGKRFHGHGTIQKNSYIYGSQIQFTPEQMDELRGNSTYSVTLTDYEGVIRTDLEGNIASGISEVMNVVADGMNVVTEDKNVVVETFRLTTGIQAFKGSQELYYSETAGKGMFYASLNCIGCSAAVSNGVVEVTDVTDLKNAYIEIEVNCEGEAVFMKEYRITAITDGYSPLYIDLDNQMDSIACDSDGNHLFGEPETHVRCFYGTKELPLKELTVQAPTGVSVTTDLTDGLVKVNRPVSASVNDSFGITINASAQYDTPQGQTMVLEGTAVFTINKVKTSAIYNLLPSVNAVKVSKDSNNDKSYSPTSVKCTIRKNDGTATTELATLPANYAMKYSTDGGEEQNYSIGTNINVTSLTKDITFYLRYAGVLIDVEKVPVVEDGDRAFNSFKSTVFIRTNSTPITPTGGSYSSPIPTSSPTWSDGIPSGEAMLWASTRVFSENGKAPQQDDWTTPRQMTDTSDFDVAYHTGNTYSGLPTFHHTADQGNGWTNTSSPDTVWMATDTKKNGVWAGWQVSKVKGEKGEKGDKGDKGDKGETGADGSDGSDGKDGENAYLYSVSPASMVIGKTSTGSLEPASYVCTCYKNGNNSQQTETAKWDIYRSNDGSSWVRYDGTTAYASQFTVTVSPSYKHYKIVARPYSDIEAVATAVIAEDGTNGSDGPAGAMPRPRGQYSPNTVYTYDSDSRDIVYDSNGDVWMVRSYGLSFSGQTPFDSSPYWIQGNKDIFTAIDTALIDGANIAGFGFKNGKMVSVDEGIIEDANESVANLVIDGRRGKLKAKDAEITGKVTANSGSIGDYEISEGELTSTRSVSGADYTVTLSAGKISFTTTEGKALTVGSENLVVTVDGVAHKAGIFTVSTGEWLGAYFANYGISMMTENGRVLMHPSSGEYVSIWGHCMKVTRISSNYAVKSNDDFILSTASSDVTVTLPSNAPEGKIIYVKGSGSGNVNVSGSIRNAADNSTAYSYSSGRMSTMFIFDGSRWNAFRGGS